MPWSDVAFTVPTSLGAIHNTLDTALSNATGALSSASVRLGTTIAPTFTLNPVALAAMNSASTWAQLAALLDVNVRCLVVHPWQQGIGQGQGVRRYLSAPNAVEAMVRKLGDTGDANLPTENQDAIALLLPAAQLSDFTQMLEAFNAVFPLPELQRVQRRAAQLERLDAEKLNTPDTPSNTRWQPRNGLQFDSTHQVCKKMGVHVAMALGYDAENISPVDELQALITKKQNAITGQQAEYATLTALFTGGSGKALFLPSSTAQQLATALANTSGPGHEYALCVGVVFLAAPGQLTFLKEVLGL